MLYRLDTLEDFNKHHPNMVMYYNPPHVQTLDAAISDLKEDAYERGQDSRDLLL